MNPNIIHKEVKFKISKSFFLLTLILIIQLLIFFSVYNSFKIPSFISRIFIKNTSTYNIKHDGAYFSLPNLLLINGINYYNKSETNRISLKNIKLKLNTIIPSSFSSIDQILVDTINFDFDKYNNTLKVKNFKLSTASGGGYISFTILRKKTRINVKGNINIEFLKNILIDQHINKVSYKSKLTNLLDLINSEFRNYDFFDSEQIIYCYINLDKRGVLRLIKKNELNCTLKFDLKKKIVDDFRSTIKNISISHLNSKLTIKNLLFSYKKKKHEDNFNNDSSHRLIIEDITYNGKFKGKVPNISIMSKLEKETLDLTLISDTNATQCTNIIKWDFNKHLFDISGNNLIFPNLINIRLIQENYQHFFVRGELLKINFDNNSSLSNYRQPNTVKINATKVSFLNSPYGNYDAEGFINDDFSIFFNKINATLSKSVVDGSFRQSWNPLQYEFILNGYCLPTDINNWLGNWWAKIWHNFTFNSQSIPHGNFKIQGVWNKPNSSIATGLINCKNIEYKNLPIKYTNINIKVDSNNTLISTSDLEHAYGNLKGTLSIPHLKVKNEDILKYEIHGIYPLNSGKKCLGTFIGNYLNDFNLTYLNTSSLGSIYLTKDNVKSTLKYKNNYFIDFFTNQKGTWNGIQFNGFNGSIKSEYGKFSLSLPVIKLNQSNISLIINSFKDKNTIDLEIKNGKINELYEAINSYQTYTGEYFIKDQISAFAQSQGIIDFNLNASSDLSDLMMLKGTGMIKVIDKEISKIHLFGILSDRLSNLPIPFPSGTLNFDKLEGLFEIDKGVVKFDKLVMTGFLTKIINKGSINLRNGELNILSKFQIVGNIELPIIRNIAKIADPLSNFTELKITGTLQDPSWEILVNSLK